MDTPPQDFDFFEEPAFYQTIRTMIDSDFREADALGDDFIGRLSGTHPLHDYLTFLAGTIRDCNVAPGYTSPYGTSTFPWPPEDEPPEVEDISTKLAEKRQAITLKRYFPAEKLEEIERYANLQEPTEESLQSASLETIEEVIKFIEIITLISKSDCWIEEHKECEYYCAHNN